MPTFEDYTFPDSWSADDILTWVRRQLTLPGVTSVEFVLREEALVARVWHKRNIRPPIGLANARRVDA